MALSPFGCSPVWLRHKIEKTSPIIWRLVGSCTINMATLVFSFLVMWRLGAIFFPKTSGFFFFARLRKFAEINNNNHNIVGLLSWIGLVGPSLAPGVSPGLLVFLRPRSSLAMLQRCRYFYCGTICFPSIVSLALHLSVESSTLSPLSPIVFLHQKIS